MTMAAPSERWIPPLARAGKGEPPAGILARVLLNNVPPPPRHRWRALVADGSFWVAFGYTGSTRAFWQDIHACFYAQGETALPGSSQLVLCTAILAAVSWGRLPGGVL